MVTFSARTRNTEMTIKRDTATTADELESFIASWLIRNAEINAAEIKRDREFADFGLDSLLAVELSGRLEKLLGRRLSPSLAWEFPTIAELAEHLAAGGSGTLEDMDGHPDKPAAREI
jgi:acyl carrier protein